MALRRGLLAAFTAAGCYSAAGADISGHYRSEGFDTTGIFYAESAIISMTSENDCHIEFSNGFEGICMVKGTTFVVAYDVHGKLGLAIYEINSDGSMEGNFIDDYHGGKLIGREKLRPAAR